MVTESAQPAAGTPASAPSELLAAAQAALPELVEIRRRLHRTPELGLDLPRTQAIVVDELRRLGLEPQLGRGISSVTAWIGRGRPGRTIVLRGDMDALPLTEETGLDFASEIDGRMHACGHDTHMTMLLGGARLLARRADELPGPVLLMFQPGEEGYAGAKVMLDAGLLDGIDTAAARAFAIHIWAALPSGAIQIRPGAMYASADSFQVTIRGRGGHASAPYLAADPVPVAAELVTALQTALSRETYVFDPAVLTVAHVAAGTTHNIIPETAFIEGTIRTLSKARREALHAMIPRVVNGICSAHGVTAEIAFVDQYPVTLNDPTVVEAITSIAADLLGQGALAPMPYPNMGAEDFSFVLERIPGAMAFLGATPPDQDPESVPNNHSNRVVFDEAAMASGTALYAAVALRL
jgi:amidohydrolase